MGLGLTFCQGFWRYWQLFFGSLIIVGAPIGTTLGAGRLLSSPFLQSPAAQLGYFAASPFRHDRVGGIATASFSVDGPL